MTQGSLKHPGRWIWLLLAIPVVLGLSRLRWDVEIFNLMPAGLAPVQGLKIHQQFFANSRELILTLEGATADDTERAAQAVAAELRNHSNLVSSVVWQPPWLEHPEDSAELIASIWLNQPPEAIAELTNRLAPDRLKSLLDSAREQLATSLSPQDIAQLSYDPFGFTRLPAGAIGSAPSFTAGDEGFASADGRFRAVFIQAKGDLTTYDECERWLGAIKARVGAALAGSPTLKAAYTGRPAFVAEIAGGMQRDITLSVGGTAVIIAALFWLAHRRVKPMLWLLALLALILGSTLALGGLIFGSINVLSMGFAAILLGLAVDYAVVHYQEALANPRLTVPQIRHAIAPSILWAAVTTIAAFLMLNFGGLPGLAQLGTLVAVGVTLAAVVMVFEFLPPLFPDRDHELEDQYPHDLKAQALGEAGSTPPSRLFAARVLTAVLLFGACVLLLLKGFPRINPTAEPLRPRNSQAYATLDRLQRLFTGTQEPLWVIVRGGTEQEVASRLKDSEAILRRGASNHILESYRTPAAIWPNPACQEANRNALRQLLNRQQEFFSAAAEAGFAPASMALAERVFATWNFAVRTAGPFWPANPMSQWILDKLTARAGMNFFALSLVYPVREPGRIPQRDRQAAFDELARELNTSDRWLTGWELLGDAIYSRVSANFLKVLVPMVCLVMLSLWFAFRRPAEILLSIGVLSLSALCLLAAMRLANASWNLMNLMAIPLILGTGVDYSIFMLLGLRRYGGNLRRTYNSVARALLLCGGTATAGFGSLAFSSNAGMASLGSVCAAGIAINMLLAIFLLPWWWLGTAARQQKSSALPDRPSSLYAAGTWKAGLLLARWLPERFAYGLSRALCRFYRLVAPHRREVVIQNLLPVLQGNRDLAERMADRLYDNFAVKIADLLRYEAGLPIEHLLGEARGWEHILQARAENRGVLLVVPHLGNWEFGAPFLFRRGVDLQVITLAEPGAGFTELRQEARTRRNIKTLVIGEDPFAFVEVIRRLENGATVALLIDRPPAPTAIRVNLFGRAFLASVAVAELARASNCVILPGSIPRRDGRYEAEVLPAINYDRAALRDRKARQELTQKIMDALELSIRNYPDQWYHFVPVWAPEE